MEQPITGEHELGSSIHDVRSLVRSRRMKRQAKRAAELTLFVALFLLFAAWGVRDAHRSRPARCTSAPMRR